MFSNLDRLTFLDVAHWSTIEIGSEDFLFDQFYSLLSLSACKSKGFLSEPDWRNSNNSHTFGHTGVHLDFRAIWDDAKEGPAVLNKKLLLVYLEDLRFKQAVADVVGKVWL